MNWDFVYLVETCLLPLCVVAFVPAFIHLRKSIPETIARNFYYLTTMLSVDCLVYYLDHVLSCVPDNRFELLRILVLVIGFICRPAMLYVVLLIVSRDTMTKRKRLLYGIPLLVIIVLALSGFFTGFVFSIDQSNVLHKGPGMAGIYLLLLVYFTMILVAAYFSSGRDRAESAMVFRIILLLLIDEAFAVFRPDINVQEQIKAITLALYFVFFLSSYRQKMEVRMQEEFENSQTQLSRTMLEETVETLSYTIEAKDRFTKGHSFRVAKYAKQIAALAHKDDAFCRNVYMAGLVHDIGKISVEDAIVNKEGLLTPEEYEQIKTHAANGARMLRRMEAFPLLQQGAASHHERYDGTGYPNGLKGEEIPEVARILAVADAYDAMTSRRSYRTVLNQAEAKQEIWMGAGTQFDPYYAKMMVSLIDADLNYDMREKPEEEENYLINGEREDISWSVPEEIRAENQVMGETDVFMLGKFATLVNNWSDPTESAMITEEGCRISFKSRTGEADGYIWLSPTAVIFTSSDGSIGEDYYELGVFETDAYSWPTGCTISESSKQFRKPAFLNWEHWIRGNAEGMEFRFTARREGSTVFVVLDNDMMRVESRLELPEDFDKPLYMAVTGEHCTITDVKIG